MKAGIKERNFLTTSVRSVDAENYRITHVVNTKGLDRYGTVVLPKGADVKHYQKNPVVLWLHNVDKSTMAMPIGRCVDLVIGEDEIQVTTEFNPNDALSMKIFNAYKDGFMNAWSIGFQPKSFEEITPVNYEEIKAKYNLHNLKLTQKDFEDNAYYGLWVIYEWELLEYSAVPVPGNPEALSDEECDKFSRELVTRGIMEDAEVRRINFRDVLKKQAEREAAKHAEAKPGDAPAAEAPAQEAAPAPAVIPAPAAEAVIPAPAEGTAAAPAAEAAPEAASSTVSTPESRQGTENVAEPTEVEALRAELATVKGENETLKATVSELSQKNDGLMARMTEIETSVKTLQETSKQEVEGLRTQVVELKKAVEVDNIESVRQVTQKKTMGANGEGFFTSLLNR